MHGRTPVLAVPLALAAVVASLATAVPARAELPAPVAAGTSAANIDLNSAGRRVLVRWVARSSGTLSALHLRIEADGANCDLTGRTGYGLGNGGTWRVTTHPVLPDGRPDERTTLSTQHFRPCEAPSEVPDIRQGVVRLAMGIAVAKGTEYATVIANDDPQPAANYSSTNFLYTSGGLIGANARNERSPLATDVYYGLDPRELVGFSKDGGQSWALPGGPNGQPAGRNFLPTYLQEYSDGLITGQPYYYTSPGQSGARTMVFQNISKSWTIRELGAYTSKTGSGTLTLMVDGRQVASAPVSGTGMLRAAIAPVTVAPGQVVRVTASGLVILNIVADTAWGRLLKLHLGSKPWYVEAEPNFTHAAPVYALPAYGAEEPAPPAVEEPPVEEPPTEEPPVEEPPPAAPPEAEPEPAPANPPAAPTPDPAPPAPTETSPPAEPAPAAPPAPDPPAAPEPDPAPPAPDPPAETSPPVAEPPPATEPPAPAPPVATPPVEVPPVVTPPELKPPPAFPPVVKPPAVRPPEVKPPVVKPPVKSPRHVRGRGGRTATECRKRARPRRAQRRNRSACRGRAQSARTRERSRAPRLSAYTAR